jgi:hypothetical protein
MVRAALSVANEEDGDDQHRITDRNTLTIISIEQPG